MNIDLTRKSAREKLAERRDPYFVTVDKGCSLGFRRGPDTWVARFKPPSGGYQFNALGKFDEFTKAKKAADDWFSQMTGGARRSVTRGTVRDACLAYLKHLKDGGRERAAAVALSKLQTSIIGNEEAKKHGPKPAAPIAGKPLESTTREDWIAWRKQLQKGRQAQTVNRYVGCVMAALNCAVSELGHVGNMEAWTLKDLHEEKAEGDTAVFLSPGQRERLTAHLPDWFRGFALTMSATGARPHEIAAATVADYDSRQNTITLRWMKGRPAKLRARVVTLDPKDAATFKAQCAGKLPGAPLIANPDGGHVTGHQWAREIRGAIELANASARKGDELIPVDASAYSYRHTRISELLQVYNVDPVTVAKQTGTSLAMMERYYWKFLPNAMREKFAALRA